MQVEYAFLADAADAPRGGKVSALGIGIDVLRVPDFPFVHNQMALVVKVRLDGSEYDRPHNIEVDILDPNDQVHVGPARATFMVARSEAAPERANFAQFVLEMAQTRYSAPGAYTFRVVMDGQELKRIPLYVERRSTAQTGDPEESILET